MSETPFRVVPCPGWPDIRNVVAPDGTKFADGLPPIVANAVADNLNSAWSAAGGPALTRQRDEAVALLRDIADAENPEHYGNARDALHSMKLRCAEFIERIDAAAIGGGA